MDGGREWPPEMQREGERRSGTGVWEQLFCRRGQRERPGGLCLLPFILSLLEGSHELSLLQSGQPLTVFNALPSNLKYSYHLTVRRQDQRYGMISSRSHSS
jgi:hypothetical protein